MVHLLGGTTHVKLKLIVTMVIGASNNYRKIPNIWKKFKLTTKPEVIHAEANAISKLGKIERIWRWC